MKHLVIISKGRNTWQTLNEQLTSLLGDYVTISGYYLCGNMPHNIQGDLILVSSMELLPEVEKFVNTKSPIIVARRSINYHAIEKLFDIPSDTDVLLANDAITAAEETISLLLALGIDHIRYHPYAPGLRNYPNLKIAITPGEPDCAPPCVEQIVDIKSRMVDITTLVEIIEMLSLSDSRANILSANYLRDIIDLIKTNQQKARNSQLLSNKLYTIINTVHDGILAIDESNTVSVINPVAEHLLALNAGDTIGENFNDVLNGKIKEQLFRATNHQEQFINHNNRQIIINSATITDNKSPAGCVYTFKDVSEIKRLEEELRRKTVKEQQIARYSLDQIAGNSEAIRDVIEKAHCLASSDSPILIQGESGTGKELLAQGIHNASSRRHGPFIAVNFAALTESLVESELFGYEEGAFTGARKGGAAGLFEQAHKGTIFLDEIGDSPLAFQIRILRVLQEKQVRRIGSSRNIPIDVRIISATNQDLKKAMLSGQFRRDLYYRLNVLPLSLPPLRARGTDILLLAKNYYEKIKSLPGSPMADCYFSLIQTHFLAYEWPGNIRELQNVIEYLVNVCPNDAPGANLLSEEMQQCIAINNVQLINKQRDSHYLKEKILEEIMKHNQNGLPIGRRSLASALSLPENTVRKIILQLLNSGRISVSRGRKGLWVIA